MRVKRNTGLVLILALMIILLSSMPVLAAQELKADTGNTAFIIICSALVLLMTPGLAFFYGGMVRKCLEYYDAMPGGNVPGIGAMGIIGLYPGFWAGSGQHHRQS
jgi:hypothetical protein